MEEQIERLMQVISRNPRRAFERLEELMASSPFKEQQCKVASEFSPSLPDA